MKEGYLQKKLISDKSKKANHRNYGWLFSFGTRLLVFVEFYSYKSRDKIFF